VRFIAFLGVRSHLTPGGREMESRSISIFSELTSFSAFSREDIASG
jgi:hypothetical protein